jgi:hypothetical protein
MPLHAFCFPTAKERRAMSKNKRYTETFLGTYFAAQRAAGMIDVVEFVIDKQQEKELLARGKISQIEVLDLVHSVPRRRGWVLVEDPEDGKKYIVTRPHPK